MSTPSYGFDAWIRYKEREREKENGENKVYKKLKKLKDMIKNLNDIVCKLEIRINKLEYETY